MGDKDVNQFMCPLPHVEKDHITISHGSGGKQTKHLIQRIFYTYFSNPILEKGDDFADIPANFSKNKPRVITATDAHIVDPIFFPGGDIGRLAVAGTVNDVSMSGAIPKFITASFIIEEGFPIIDLDRIARSMAECALEADVQIIAGDTKVVEKGKSDKIFISTTGIGFLETGVSINGASAKPGDVVIMSGTIGDHGIAVLAARNDLGFRVEIQSDVNPLNELIQSIRKASKAIHVLRDPTRGGVATTLNEISEQSNVSIVLDELKLPIRKSVQAACDILGFDPLYVANEGKVLIIAPRCESNAILDALHTHPLGRQARQIGVVEKAKSTPNVLMKTTIGGTRIVDMLSGKMLPRIC